MHLLAAELLSYFCYWKRAGKVPNRTGAKICWHTQESGGLRASGGLEDHGVGRRRGGGGGGGGGRRPDRDLRAHPRAALYSPFTSMVAVVPATAWKQRARSSLPLAPDGTRAGDHDRWSLWLPPGNSSPARPPLRPPKPLLGSPARPVPPPLRGRERLRQGGRKKQAIDLGASVLGGGMFDALVPVQLAYATEGSNRRPVGPWQVYYARVCASPWAGASARHGSASSPRTPLSAWRSWRWAAGSCQCS